jgi:hypothetical protein
MRGETSLEADEQQPDNEAKRAHSAMQGSRKRSILLTSRSALTCVQISRIASLVAAVQMGTITTCASSHRQIFPKKIS